MAFKGTEINSLNTRQQYRLKINRGGGGGGERERERERKEQHDYHSIAPCVIHGRQVGCD